MENTQKMLPEQARLQQEILLIQLEMKERTLKRISEEIHDNIGQTLSLAKLTLQAMEMEKEVDFEKLSRSGALVGKAIQDLRQVSSTHQIETLLKAGLIRGIEETLVQLKKAGAHQITLKVEGDVVPFAAQKELIVYWIVQEAIHQFLKGATTTCVTITCGFAKEVFWLTIEGSRKGFASEQKIVQTQVDSGLLNMQNRVALIGGRLKLEEATPYTAQLKLELQNYMV